MKNISKHFGVYGVHVNAGQLLCIHKNAGPYQNRYDLPGGSQEIGESLTETLVREVKEETGFTVKSYANNRIYDVFVKPHQETMTVHHIFAVYDVELDFKKTAEIPSQVIDGNNDSDGVAFVDIDTLNIANASPLVLKIVDEINKKEGYLEKLDFLDWQIIPN
ncbi:NUDIX hydrolase [Bacilli bacterium]|nr:NUDIX hydrolase [Bacilli bacterium]